MKILALELEQAQASAEQFEPHLRAEAALDSLPLVQAGLIRFELIPLSPYPGFARLFADAGSEG